MSISFSANYSQPVLHGPTESRPNIEEEITFTCKSSGGYPEPKVYWTNEDNISLPEPNMTVIQDPDGTYSVFSTLKIKSTSKMKIGCSIENRVLQQNLTTPSKIFNNILHARNVYTHMYKHIHT